MVKPLAAPKQRELYEQLAKFTDWMNRPKDAAEIQKDSKKAVPVSQLPMLF
ncbi:hypothetical protein GCM10023313_05830 [Mucilaginibacter defluvii]|uniref:Uncharacterized protein n=1 Tax=Mucilaginibacter defluvii TaxID=1196019 RepID=A0ABP9FJX7_9SPHI